MRYMDYNNFKKEYEEFEEWNSDKGWEYLKNWELPKLSIFNQEGFEGGERWLKIAKDHDKVLPVDNDGNFYHPEAQNDMVNSPAHYTRGTQEVIDIIEEAIQDAPDVKAGMLQAQVLKYLLRLWLKSNAPQDAQKAQWYLTRLIKHLGETE